MQLRVQIVCGIFGVWYQDGRGVCKDAVIRSRDAMTHRGPDDAGLYIDGNVALAHRRLSIIDLSEAGRQPMANETSDVWAVVNGEIYNFQPLRDELVTRGHRFHSDSDSEVVVHGYEEWGDTCFERFNGMFAIGIWDARRRRMLLARDPNGKKPLYYYHVPGKQLLYASTLKPLSLWPDFPRDIDQAAVYEYLRQFAIPRDRSIFRGTHKVLPGHYIVFDENGSANQAAYWDIVEIAQARCDNGRNSDREYIDELYDLLKDAVKKRMVSDVPLGAFLSGGMDSSLVVALMGEVSSSPISTYTIGFQEKDFDESDYAHRVAKHLGVENTMLPVSGRQMLDLVPDVIRYYDEPMSDYSQFPSMAVSKLARRHVTVVLTGDGGDEVFGGYNGYLATYWFDRYARVVPSRARTALAAFHRFVPHARTRTVVKRSGLDDAATFFGTFKDNTRHVNGDSLIPAGTTAVKPIETAARFLRTRTNMSITEAAMLHDLTHSMIDAILHKVDRATMAYALEARSPLLDKRVVECAIRMPFDLRIRGRWKKYALRKILGRFLPPDLIDRPKLGFTPPMREWLRGELKPMLTDLLSPETVRRRGYFIPEGVQTLVSEHLGGRANHANLLWAMLMLELWLQEYV